ncbi:MAG TPA: hypothetical protein VEO95_05860 [Chthoniobacteraceae bacterium]|nr:hypothetical protein [Chthoniobacteraceae bacterium]
MLIAGAETFFLRVRRRTGTYMEAVEGQQPAPSGAILAVADLVVFLKIFLPRNPKFDKTRQREGGASPQTRAHGIKQKTRNKNQ